MIKQTNSIKLVVMICGALAFNLCAMQNEQLKQVENLTQPKETNTKRGGWCVSKNEEKIIAQQDTLIKSHADLKKDVQALQETVEVLLFIAQYHEINEEVRQKINAKLKKDNKQ